MNLGGINMKNSKISNTQLQAIVFLEMIGMEAMILPKIAGNIYTILIMSIFTAQPFLTAKNRAKNGNMHKNTVRRSIV